MLLDGLRSCEILALQLEDLRLAAAQMRVAHTPKLRGLSLGCSVIIYVDQQRLGWQQPPRRCATVRHLADPLRQRIEKTLGS